jgi:hypothetical protein
MRKRVNLGIFGRVSVYATETGESILTIDIHRARTTDTLSARTTEGERGVDFILDFDECVKNLMQRKAKGKFKHHNEKYVCSNVPWARFG